MKDNPILCINLNVLSGIISHRKKTLIASSLAIVLEWYDFALYGYFALVFARLFFPSDNELTSLLSAFGVFALSFLMRPLGAVIFGHFGDRVGRKKALMFSVTLMVVSTTLIGILPVYNQVGIFATSLLILLKLIQGISVGGEKSSSVSFLVEHAPPSRRGFFGSCALCSTTGGILLASAMGALITSVLSQDAVISWGWRIPFLLGFLPGGVVLYLRTNIEEPKVFKSREGSGEIPKAPIREALREHWREVLTTMGATLVVSVGFYMIFVYMITFVSNGTNVPLSSALNINAISMAVLMVLIPIMGALSDSIGRKPLLIAGCVGVTILGYFVFHLFSQGKVLYNLGAQLVFALVLAMIAGPFAATIVEHFPTRVRMSGMSLGYGVGFAVFGGTTPLIATYLIKKTGSGMAPSIYLIFVALISLFVFLKMRETYREPLK